MDDHNAESQMSRQVKRQWLRRMAKVGRRTEIKPPFLRRPRNLLPLQALAFSDDDLPNVEPKSTREDRSIEIQLV